MEYGKIAEGTLDQLPEGVAGNLRPESFHDEAIRILLEEEKVLKAELSGIRESQRNVMSSKDTAIRKHNAAMDKFNAEIVKELDNLYHEKDLIHRQIDDLRKEQNEIMHSRDELRMLDFDISALERIIAQDTQALSEEEARLKTLEAQRKSESTPKAASKKASAEKDSGSGAKPSKAEERLNGMIAKHREKKIELAAKRAERSQKLDRRATIREQLQSLSKGSAERDAKFTALRNELSAVQQRIAEGVNKRKQRPSNEAVVELKNLQVETSNRRNVVQARLEEIRRSIPYFLITFNPECRFEVIGRGGATIEQLQKDFGVVLNVDGTEGKAYIIGGRSDIESCEAALATIIAEAEHNSHRASVKFDPSLAKQFIGTRGSNIEKMQASSGARIQVKADVITLEGTKDAVDAALKLVNEFLDSMSTGELSFDEHLLELLIGRGGSTIRNIEKESGVRSLRILRDQRKIVANGKAAAVEAALNAYKDLITSLTEGDFTMHCDDVMIKTVIGPRGKTIRDIENSTGATVRTSKGKISICGTKEAVQAAREMIEDIGRREQIRIPVDTFTMNLLVDSTATISTAWKTENGDKKKDDEREASHESKEVAPLDDEANGGSKDGEVEEEEVGALEAIRLASQCDRIIPLRPEGVLLVRGRQENVNHARVLVEQFQIKHRPHQVNVPFKEVLLACMLRRVDGKKNVLASIQDNFSHGLRIEVDRANNVFQVISLSEQEASNAAQTLAKWIAENSSKIRVFCNFPSMRLGRLIGPQGRNISEIQTRTGTEIAVLKEVSEVHVFHPEGDEKMLDIAMKDISNAATS